MRNRPFVSASESPRPFSDVLAERRSLDPVLAARDRKLEEILELERLAAIAPTPAERNQIQCEAEALRCALDNV